MYLFNIDDVEPGSPENSFHNDFIDGFVQHSNEIPNLNLSEDPELCQVEFNRKAELDKASATSAQLRKKRGRRDDENSRSMLKQRSVKRQKAVRKLPEVRPTTEKKACIVLSTDLGSMYTGASYQTNQHSARNGVVTVHNYPGDPSAGGWVVKMPSRIAYASENQSWGPDGKTLREDVIGYQVKPGMRSYVCTKLLLDQDAELTVHDDELLRTKVGASYLKLPTGKTAQDVIADFLCLFRKTIMKQLADIHGRTINAMPFQYIVTVPAIWSSRAISQTISAFQRAGFHADGKLAIRTVSEPIAGGLAALVGMKDKSPDVLDKIRTCMIIDGGGGTIDLEVIEVVPGAKLSIKELIPGDGGKCGSTTIDRQFISLMNRRFGEYFEALDEFETGPTSSFMACFEREKRGFEGDLNDTHRISLPALKPSLEAAPIKFEGYDLRNSEVLLTGGEMADLFDKTIDEICKLGEKLLRALRRTKSAPPDAVIFLGGLATSSYIWGKVKEYFQQQCGDGTILLRPDDPWGAVSYGAVVYALESVAKVSRIARRHYGIEVTKAFRGTDYDEEQVTDCPLYGRRTKEIEYLIKKSEELKDSKGGHVKRLPGYLAITSVALPDLQFSWDVFCSNDDEPPKSRDDDGVHELGKLNIDLTEWAQKKGRTILPPISAIHPYKLRINLVISGTESGGIVNIRAIADRKEVGRYLVDYTEE